MLLQFCFSHPLARKELVLLAVAEELEVVVEEVAQWVAMDPLELEDLLPMTGQGEWVTDMDLLEVCLP